jgi:hypothetical protein
MCLMCRAFEALYGTDVGAALDPSRNAEYERLVLQPRRQGHPGACLQDGCDLALMGARRARKLGLGSWWKFCETHGRERAGRR